MMAAEKPSKARFQLQASSAFSGRLAQAANGLTAFGFLVAAIGYASSPVRWVPARRGAIALDSFQVLVDFARPSGTPSPGNGFLLSAVALRNLRDGALPQGLLDALSPTYWRVGTTAQARRVISTRAHVTFLVSDAYRARFWLNGKGPWPFEQPGRFASWLDSLATANRDLPMVWEVWNEPDYRGWWAGSETQAFDTYLRADNVLRAALGDTVTVAGPSLSHFDADALHRFAEFCLARGCQVNAVVWHELRKGTAATIPEHVRWVEDSLVRNPRYGPLHIRQVQVNETVSKIERYSTGDLVVVLSSLARSGVDAFARSCWQEFTSREYECANASLDGIIDSASGEPRPAWWIYAAYAGIRVAPVAVLGDSGVAALAGKGTAERPAEILIGSCGGRPITVRLWLKNVAKSSAAVQADTAYRVVVRRVPWSGLDAPLSRLPTVRDTVVHRGQDVDLLLEVPGSSVVASRPDDPLVGSDAFLITVERLAESANSGPYWPVYVTN